jgi:hypothetical protein
MPLLIILFTPELLVNLLINLGILALFALLIAFFVDHYQCTRRPNQHE